MDLYSFPKDILVKMLSTIREDTKKDYEIYKNKWEKIENNSNVLKCSNCSSFTIEYILNIECEEINNCYSCSKLFCDNCYLKGIDGNYSCLKCYEFLKRKESFKKCSIKKCCSFETDDFALSNLEECYSCKKYFCENHMRGDYCKKCNLVF